MLKKIAAIGVSAAIAFAPLAAIAQTDQAAPGAAPAASEAKPMAAKPMKKKTHHMREEADGARVLGRSRPRRESAVIEPRLASVSLLTSTASSLGRGGFVSSPSLLLSPCRAPCQTRRGPGTRKWQAQSSGTNSRAPIPIQRR